MGALTRQWQCDCSLRVLASLTCGTGVCCRLRYGRFTFVDLAGSERLGESESKGKTAHETGHINKSLFNLGKVIAVLAKGQGQVRERGAFGSMRLKSFRRSPSKSTMAARVRAIAFTDWLWRLTYEFCACVAAWLYVCLCLASESTVCPAESCP